MIKKFIGIIFPMHDFETYTQSAIFYSFWWGMFWVGFIIFILSR